MFKRLLSLLLEVVTLLSLCACGSDATATMMKLVQTEGTAHVLDADAKEQPIVSDMNLYTGYDVGTESASYAWVDLDSVKLLKLDENSDIGITKDGNKLRIDLNSGSMFFCVLEPLSDSEELELATTNMAMSIRGTTGVLQVISESESRLVLIEGEIEFSAPDGTVAMVTTGQVAQIIVDETGAAETTVRDIEPSDVPEFAYEMIEENADIQEKITSGGGNLEAALAEEPITEATEETTEATEALSDEELAEQMYAEVFQRYREAVASSEIIDYEGISYRENSALLEVCLKDSVESLGIYYQDMDGDGVLELLVCDVYPAGDYSSEQHMIRGIYTIRDGEAVCVAAGWSRSSLYLCEDGYLYSSGSDGAAHTAYYIYQIVDRECVTLHQIDYFTEDAYNYPGAPVTYGENYTPITREEANAILDDYTIIEFIPLPFPEA